MGQALYRKYRPRNLSEAVGQTHITDTLEHAVKSGRIGHAYLFTGPRGTGKTSIARILAHEINGLSYTDDSTHLDIIEIDAASNRRIDEIRDLRDRVNIAPTSAKYKVYIIDEVHMLTREAFNALLKTLEEPPAHVVFILATTDVHKLPETIISRTQRFTFKPVPLDQVAAHLRFIAEQEKIQITDEALALIARHGEGSFRDSISLLDQAGGHADKIDETYVRSLLGIPSDEAVNSLRQSLQAHDARTAITMLSDLRTHGYQPTQIARRLGDTWRSDIIINGIQSANDFALLERLLNVPAAHDPERYLEIVLLEFALQGSPQARSTPAAKQQPESRAPIEKPTSKNDTPTPKAHASSPKPTSIKDENTITPKEKPLANPDAITFDEAVWSDILTALKQKYNTLYGVVRLAQPTFRPDEIELAFSFAFHRKRLSEAKNQKILLETIEAVTGRKVAISCTLSTEKPTPDPAAQELVAASAFAPAPAPEIPAQPAISTISNIFGGGELLES